MKTENLDITYEESVIQVENWPQSEPSPEPSNEETPQIDNVAMLPVCKDGVCQLGAWKPRKSA